MTDSIFSLSNNIALVTGASQGLGFEIAKGFWEAGAHVILNGRSQPRLETAIHQISETGDRLTSLPFDVSDAQAVEAAFQTLQTNYGRLDILVNNVGIRDRRSLQEFDIDAIDKMWQVNLRGPMLLAQQAAQMMIEQEYGRIINLTSIAGFISNANDTVYTTMKGGLTALTRALAADLGPHKINVNGIAPGYFATETNQYMVEKQFTWDWLKQRTSLQRWGNPEEIVGTAVFLASPASSYITGHILAVDGGYLAHW